MSAARVYLTTPEAKILACRREIEVVKAEACILKSRIWSLPLSPCSVGVGQRVYSGSEISHMDKQHFVKIADRIGHPFGGFSYF
jgi:hypothetical protein